MKEELAKKWTAALRSGEYEQCTGVLYNGEGYCCLGVLCKVMGEKFSCVSKGIFYIEGEGDSTEVLPLAITSKAGMRSQRGDIILLDDEGNEIDDNLACLNDNGKTFAEIADIIDRRWEDL